MKRQLFIIALLLMPISITYLHAQENKHAQAMYKAFREAINCKLPKNISSKWVSDSEDSLSRFFDNPDGGGLVPKNKIHEVKLGKDKVEIGPNYLDTWNFEFNNVPDDPNLPLRQLLDAFDKQAPYASSYYSYVAGDEQAAFPGVSIAYGEDGQTASISLHPMLNVRIIGFKDDDGFRSTYLLSWWSYEEDDPIDDKHKYYITDGKMYSTAAIQRLAWRRTYCLRCAKRNPSVSRLLTPIRCTIASSIITSRCRSNFTRSLGRSTSRPATKPCMLSWRS